VVIVALTDVFIIVLERARGERSGEEKTTKKNGNGRRKCLGATRITATDVRRRRRRVRHN
jgi:hypothetical protein